LKGFFPNAYIIHKGKILKILNVRLLSKVEINKLDKKFTKNGTNGIGRVLVIFKNEGLVISTKTEPLLIKEIKLEGKNTANKNQLIQQLNLKLGEKI